MGRFVDALPVHALRLLVGIDVVGPSEALTACPRPKRPVIDLADAIGRNDDSGEIVRRAVRDLGRIVAERSPFLWDEDLSDVRDDPLGQAYLALRASDLARRLPGVSSSWAAEASMRMLRGHGPCAPGTGAAHAWRQLVVAFSPVGLILVSRLSERSPAAFLAALEWLADIAPTSVLLLAPTLLDPGGPFDRALFGASRFVTGEKPGPSEEAAADVLSDVEVDGRPHPGSIAERRLYEMIRADLELAPLLTFNRTVAEVTRVHARVDILWPTGRVAIEVDGPEHRGPARYRADRHRDYELMCAGYRVLSLRVQTGGTTEIVRLLADEEVQVGIAMNPPRHPHLRSVLTLGRPIRLVVPSDRPLAHLGRAVTLAEVAPHPIAAKFGTHGLQQAVDRAEASAGVRLDVVLRTSSTTAVQRFVLGGSGGAFMSAHDVGSMALPKGLSAVAVARRHRAAQAWPTDPPPSRRYRLPAPSPGC